ncbi:hypothetical protein [Methylobacter sp. sgz302048]|uniref:hypothetical protein n=1 Tax=Methylobacter sp. sgz302048 TaxID=3455945 RepID=UPI003F9ED7A4
MHLFRFIQLILSLALLSGCFQTKLDAPPGREVRILSREEPAEFKKEYKNWYLFYGMIPVWTTQPVEIIRKENLVEVRAQTMDTVADAIITLTSSLLPVLVFPQHVIVEGNREPTVAGRKMDGVVHMSAGPVAAGTGTLSFQGRDYEYDIKGLSIADAGVSSLAVDGAVYNLKSVNDFNGIYHGVKASVNVGGGAEAIALKNDRGVIIVLTGSQQDLKFSFPLGVTIQLKH